MILRVKKVNHICFYCDSVCVLQIHLCVACPRGKVSYEERLPDAGAELFVIAIRNQITKLFTDIIA